MAEKRNPALIDIVISDREWPGAAPSKNTLRSAHKFIFDASASRRFGELLKDAGVLFLQQHEFSRPPYDVTWIELNQTEYWRAATDTEPDATADTRIGFLYNHGKVYSYSQAHGNSIGIFPITYLLNTPVSFEDELAIATACGLSRLTYRQHVVGSVGISNNDLAGPVITDFCRSHKLEFDEGLYPNIEYDEKTRYNLLKSSAGDLKRILALCLLLSRPGKRLIQTREFPRTIGLRRGRRVVYMAHNVVTIHLDRKTVVKKISQAIERSVRRRHEVRGHWAQQRKGATRLCDHEWDALDPYHYVCTKCGIRRWWRKAHARGDASRGFVVKEYKVKK